MACAARHNNSTQPADALKGQNSPARQVDRKADWGSPDKGGIKNLTSIKYLNTECHNIKDLVR